MCKKIETYIRKALSVAATIALSAATGVCAGAVCAIFGRGLLIINNFRDAHQMATIPFLALVGLIIVFVYKKWGKGADAGMSLVFDAEFNARKNLPLRMAPLAAGATWLSHLGGASVGREGVACQIGAAIGGNIGKAFKNERLEQTLIVAGIAGGFAGLFRTPVAAVCFALEVMIAGQFFYRALVPAIVAAGSASAVSGLFGIAPESVPLARAIGSAPAFTPLLIAKLVALALLFCLVGCAFSFLLNYFRKLFAHVLPNPYRRIFVVGVAMSALLLLVGSGRYAGLSLSISETVFSGGRVFAFDWLFKMLFTVACLSAGFTGGELTPLFVIGSSFGCAVAPLFDLPPLFCAALGYGAVFGSATNTLLAPIAIAGTVFGFEYTPAFALVCAVAYCCNGNRSIYARQKVRVD